MNRCDPVTDLSEAFLSVLRSGTYAPEESSPSSAGDTGSGSDGAAEDGEGTDDDDELDDDDKDVGQEAPQR